MLNLIDLLGGIICNVPHHYVKTETLYLLQVMSRPIVTKTKYFSHKRVTTVGNH